MESMMFYTSQKDIILFSHDRLPGQDTLRDHCLDSAESWVLKRRANLPYLPARRLPAVVGGG
jgi:hypothetical protein